MKPTRLLSIIASLVLASLVLGCTDHGTRHIIACADSLSLTRPDSAMAIMDSIGQTKDRLSHSEQMYYELIRAKVQNRAYIDFTTDSVMLLVADYYDHHGSANDRMLAHYLLGCTYRDMKEAPMSLQCYYDAVEAADTTSSDCDYRTMMSIWGQIATILDKQYMPMEELEALKQYQKYALLSGDTLNYIRGLEHRIKAYNLLCATDSILKITEETHVQYSRYGYDKEAASVYPSAICIYLDRLDYAKAHELMCIFENESGLFDENGNIQIGREYYYTLKGRYYYGMQNLDSAQSYFRKRLAFNKNSADTYAYMLRLYAQNGNTDSLLEYSEQLCEAYNQLQTDLHAEAMHQVKGMYDYTRNQKIAHQKEQETLRGKIIFAIFVFIVLALAIASYLIHRSFKKKKLCEISLLNDNYISTALLYKKALNEQELLKRDYELHYKTKEQELRRLKEQLTDLQTQYEAMTSENKKAALHTSNIVQCFHHFSPMDNEHPNDKDWDELDLILSQCVPSFYHMIKHSCLNINEQHVCMLISIGCSSKDASNLLHTQQQHISNIKSTANSKLFNDKSARTLEVNLVAAMKNA